MSRVQVMVDAGISVRQAHGITGTNAAAVSAAGTNQATATLIAADNNLVTTASAGQGVVLPSYSAGDILIANGATVDVLVYPASGASLNNGSANAAITLVPGAAATFKAISATSVLVVIAPSYSASTWTPVLTFATAGDLAVVYSLQSGWYVKVGNLVTAGYSIITSTFTHTTASGAVRITGLPVASANTSIGTLQWRGITKAGYTDISTLASAANGSLLTVPAHGSGVAPSSVAAADMPTGGTVALIGTVQYPVQ